MAASATSTFKNDYCIDLQTHDAPEGTIFTGLDNVPLQTYVWEGTTLWRVPTKAAVTNLNLNDEEYAGDFKICIPVRNAPESCEIIRFILQITQTKPNRAMLSQIHSMRLWDVAVK